MFKYEARYDDFDGNAQIDTLYFHLTTAELSEMELSENGGLEGMLRNMIETADNAKIVKYFKEMILKSYGIRSADGKSFIKYDSEGRPLARQFMQSAAYDAFFMDLAQNTDLQIKFMNGILPKKLQEQAANPEIRKQIKENRPEFAKAIDALETMESSVQ